MRISDWSSDVCSSDLRRECLHLQFYRHQYCSTSTSVKSSDKSGSGEDSAKSAASATIFRISFSKDLSSSSETPASSKAGSRPSIGSDFSRTVWTSSRERSLAGSDLEWDRKCVV